MWEKQNCKTSNWTGRRVKTTTTTNKEITSISNRKIMVRASFIISERAFDLSTSFITQTQTKMKKTERKEYNNKKEKNSPAKPPKHTKRIIIITVHSSFWYLHFNNWLVSIHSFRGISFYALVRQQKKKKMKSTTNEKW